MDSHIIKAEKWDELCAGLDKQNLLLSPFCGEISCEENIKKDSARWVYLAMLMQGDCNSLYLCFFCIYLYLLYLPVHTMYLPVHTMYLPDSIVWLL